MGELHAAPAAAGRGLQQDRVADRAGCLVSGGDVAHRLGRARHGWEAEPLHFRFRANLVAHQPDVFGRGTDKGEAVLLDGGGEIGILGQKTDAGMDRIGAGDRGGGQDRRNIEITGPRRGRADTDSLIGEPHIHRMRVGGRMHRDGFDSELVAGAMDAQRDLAAIGDQHLLEHRLDSES